MNYGEFLAIAVHLKKMGNDDEHLQKAFLFFDRNRSGYIEIEELRDALSDDELDDNSEEVISAIMRDVDTDKVRVIYYFLVLECEMCKIGASSESFYVNVGWANKLRGVFHNDESWNGLEESVKAIFERTIQ